jgi:hypothetical protein
MMRRNTLCGKDGQVLAVAIVDFRGRWRWRASDAMFSSRKEAWRSAREALEAAAVAIGVRGEVAN